MNFSEILLAYILLSQRVNFSKPYKNEERFPIHADNYNHKYPSQYYSFEFPSLIRREEHPVYITTGKPETASTEKEEGEGVGESSKPDEEEKEKEKPEKEELSPIQELIKDVSKPEFYLPIFNDLTFIFLILLFLPGITLTVFIPIMAYVAGSLLIPVVRLNYYVNHHLNPNAVEG